MAIVTIIARNRADDVPVRLRFNTAKATPWVVTSDASPAHLTSWLFGMLSSFVYRADLPRWRGWRAYHNDQIAGFQTCGLLPQGDITIDFVDDTNSCVVTSRDGGKVILVNLNRPGPDPEAIH